jgi:hypothetical protein
MGPIRSTCFNPRPHVSQPPSVLDLGVVAPAARSPTARFRCHPTLPGYRHAVKSPVNTLCPRWRVGRGLGVPRSCHARACQSSADAGGCQPHRRWDAIRPARKRAVGLTARRGDTPTKLRPPAAALISKDSRRVAVGPICAQAHLTFNASYMARPRNLEQAR